MTAISVVMRSDLLIYSLLLNIVLIIYVKKQTYKSNYSATLFNHAIISIAIVTVFEAVSWLTGEIGNTAQIPIHYISNMLFLASIGVPAAFAMKYLDYKVFQDEEKCKKTFVIYLVPTFLNITLSVYNLINKGFLFYIDETNQYHRGTGVYIGSIVLYVYFALFMIYIYRHKSLVSGRIVQVIMAFFLTPVIGSLLQTFFYGTTFGMPSYTLAAFLVFLILEKDEMGKDELTHLYARSSLESRLRYKLKSPEPFTIIMADLNDFKKINDEYGHLEGDIVLKIVAEILRLNTNLEDMVCRYGGDEFVLLIECGKDIGGKIISRIDHSLSKHCDYEKYTISLSYGYEYVSNPAAAELDTLMHEVDKKMYEDKVKRKSIQ